MQKQFVKARFFQTLIFEHTLLIAVVAMLAAFTLIDVFLGKRMLFVSIRISVAMQRVALFVPSFALSHVLLYLFIAYCLAAFFARSDKYAAAERFAAFFLLIHLSNLLKLLYADPRPSFLTTRLSAAPYYCERDYGKPSGHAMISAGVLLAIAQDLGRGRRRLATRLAVLALCLVGVLAMCVSRLYFGVHSFNQLLLGLLWGFALFLALGAAHAPLRARLYRPALDAAAVPGRRRAFRLLAGGLGLAMSVSLLVMWGVDLALTAELEQSFAAVSCWGSGGGPRAASTKLAASGLLGVFLPAFLLGLHFSPYAPHLGLQLCYDRRWGWTAARFAVLGAMVAPMALAWFPASNIEGVEIARAALIVPIVAGITGFLYLPMLKLLRIPFKTEM